MPSRNVNGHMRCPLCHSMVMIDSLRAWEKHVFRDLQPYICLSTTCITPDRLYSRRADWSRHMRLQHWRLWKCPFGCDEDLRTAKDFKLHILSTHFEEVSEQHYGDLVHLCSTSDPTQSWGKCLFCEHRLTSDDDYISHMASHLERISLFALPPVSHSNRSPSQRAILISVKAIDTASTTDNRLGQLGHARICLRLPCNPTIGPTREATKR
ncbi:hypothetical protein B0T09DRAFT_186216 [Sordaria sp. MPI-SDFR-AT-0083]|nr:hypothetical protein B0T09DRAFT_186216 [Sordaria sp. MPI-SDFR-AT-0083]